MESPDKRNGIEWNHPTNGMDLYRITGQMEWNRTKSPDKWNGDIQNQLTNGME